MIKTLSITALLICYSCIHRGEARNTKPAVDLSKTKLKAAEALSYCRQHKLDTSMCILIDMSAHSGINRFMVWSFEHDSIVLFGLVSHGCCGYTWGSDQTKANPGFSNVDGSHCTSLGKFKLGKRGYSNWGIHINYAMHGLEKGNANAAARQIVFHSWNDVADTETYPAGTPEGWGCPAVSNNLMTKADQLLKGKEIPVLMWIYE